MASQRLVDDDRRRRVAGVVGAETAATTDWYAERLEISGGHIAQIECERRSLKRRTTGHPEVDGVCRPPPVLKRQHLRKPGSAHARELSGAIGDLVEGSRLGLRR